MIALFLLFLVCAVPETDSGLCGCPSLWLSLVILLLLLFLLALYSSIYSPIHRDSFSNSRKHTLIIIVM
jgi:hypothetical protein